MKYPADGRTIFLEHMKKTGHSPRLADEMKGNGLGSENTVMNWFDEDVHISWRLVESLEQSCLLTNEARHVRYSAAGSFGHARIQRKGCGKRLRELGTAVIKFLEGRRHLTMTPGTFVKLEPLRRVSE